MVRNGGKVVRIPIHKTKAGVFYMFMGEFNHAIDTKGRLIIPSKFRDELGDEFVVTRGLDGCLFVFSNEKWNELEKKLSALSLTDGRARKLSRFFVAGATPCELDKQGRILLPVSLREFAGLDKEVVLTGMLNRIEIWDKTKWSDNNSFEDMDEIAEQMTDFEIVI